MSAFCIQLIPALAGNGFGCRQGGNTLACPQPAAEPDSPTQAASSPTSAYQSPPDSLQVRNRHWQWSYASLPSSHRLSKHIASSSGGGRPYRDRLPGSNAELDRN